MTRSHSCITQESLAMALRQWKEDVDEHQSAGSAPSQETVPSTLRAIVGGLSQTLHQPRNFGPPLFCRHPFGQAVMSVSGLATKSRHPDLAPRLLTSRSPPRRLPRSKLAKFISPDLFSESSLPLVLPTKLLLGQDTVTIDGGLTHTLLVARTLLKMVLGRGQAGCGKRAGFLVCSRLSRIARLVGTTDASAGSTTGALESRKERERGRCHRRKLSRHAFLPEISYRVKHHDNHSGRAHTDWSYSELTWIS